MTPSRLTLLSSTRPPAFAGPVEVDVLQGPRVGHRFVALAGERVVRTTVVERVDGDRFWTANSEYRLEVLSDRA